MEWFVSGERVDSNSDATDNGDGNDDDGDECDGNKNANNNKHETQSSSFSPGAISTVLTEDVDVASESITVTFANVLRSGSSVAFATRHMLSINPSLFGISIGVVPVVGAAAVVLNKYVKRATAEQRQCSERAAAFAEERINHVETVKLSHREKDEVKEYVRLQEECVQLGRSVSHAKGCFMGFVFAATGGALYMVFHAGGKDIAAGKMTSGELTSFATYSFLLGLGTSGVFKALGEASQGLVCADRVYRLMDADEEDRRSEQTTLTTKSNNGNDEDCVDADSAQSISLEKVCFSYRSSPDKPILKSVTLNLQRGKVVALVGKRWNIHD